MLRLTTYKKLRAAPPSRCAGNSRSNCHAQTKGEQLFAFGWLVGADGIEPPTYAL
jgi:hypothetical protein